MIRASKTPPRRRQKIFFPALSVAMHMLIIAALLIPNSKAKKNISQQPQIIAIDIVQIGKQTNIKVATDTEKTISSTAAEIPQEKTELVQKPDIVDTYKETMQQATQITAQENAEPNVVVAEIPAQDTAAKQKPKPIPPTPAKPNIKKIAPPQKKPAHPMQSNKRDEDELFNLLKNIPQNDKVVASAQQGTEKTNGIKGMSDQEFNDKKQAAIKITDMIQNRFMSCWHIPAAAKDIQNIKVALRLKMDQTGRVTHIRILDHARYQSDKFFSAVTNSALRAIQLCSPIVELQNYDHNIWADLTLIFDPGALLERAEQ